MLIEVTAIGAAVTAIGAIAELIRRSVAEGRWRASIEKDIQHLKDEVVRVDQSANARITKAQAESSGEQHKVWETLDALKRDVSEIKIAIARIETALEQGRKVIRSIAPFVAIAAWMLISFYAVTNGAVERERKQNQPLKDLDRIEIKPEGSDCENRKYETYHHDFTRYEDDRGLEERIVRSMGGRVYSPYDDQYFGSTSETDIEHIVARKEAFESGLCREPSATKIAYTTALENLTLASPEVNRSKKGSKDFADWKPQEQKARCWMAATVVRVKMVWSLSVDQRERDALLKVIKGCDSFDFPD